jgi:hypothetical protein
VLREFSCLVLKIGNMLMGARLRIGPELEITGYGCLDHFLESVSNFPLQ